MRGRLALIGAAVGVAGLPLPPSLIERLYSARLYPALQAWMTAASNVTPIALVDLLVLGGLALWIALGLRTISRRAWWPGALAAIAMRTVTWAAALYLVFALTWGLNYRRIPLVQKLRFDAARVSSDGARDLALIAVAEVNARHAGAHSVRSETATAGAPLDVALAAAFARAQRDLGALRLATPARPKWTIFNPYFQRAGVSGMTDPFFLETLLADDLLPVERPFVIAHEWSHLAGITDEGEANFTGWLTCVRGTQAHQYSGWLFLFGELTGAVRRSDRDAIMAALAPGPRDDLRAIAQRVQQHVNPRVATAGWRVYDQYLKANRVEHGAASYAEVVRLVLGVRFDAAWVPIR